MLPLASGTTLHDSEEICSVFLIFKFFCKSGRIARIAV